MAPTKSLKFHAGKVQYDEETNRCTPLPYKGVISIKPSIEDPEFLDFTWTPKQDQTQQLNQLNFPSTHPSSSSSLSQVNGSTAVEKDELLLMPGDVTIRVIKSCNTGRVFALTFMSSGAKYLYWLQDVGDIDHLNKFTEKDNKIIQQISDLVTVNEDEDDEDDNNDDEQQRKPGDIEMGEPIKTQEMKKNESDSTQSQSQSQIKTPIGSISSVLDIPTIEAHLSKLSTKELKEKYFDYLPPSIASNPTKDQIINDVIRSGFYQQCEQKLSQSLTGGNGAGYLLAQSLKYDYQGEGIENFLNGIRDVAEKEKKEKEEK
ncbi:hypothetical protein KGF56_000156 [Candida oxycetoniae]|uniref:Pru domain-containing protein n=1 Tax=Candida oxycetoniae TaxID=497107 RepID=A0AAI9T1V9_9ASCO|nr:uncharacterized protein KGF56_000156 [Candida oxycetoniae]KAI3407068.2 hypothetical protein KGF56_000156 [Candida oxycetoniae]